MAIRRQRYVRPAPRTSIWIGANLASSSQAASTSVLLGSLSAAALALRPFTVVRSRLLFMYSSDQSSAIETPLAELGLIVVSDQAVAAGIGSIPDPTADTDADWFVYESAGLKFDFTTGTGYRIASVTRDINSKAMRKVGPNQDIAIVGTNAAAVGGTFTLRGRMLVKLH